MLISIIIPVYNGEKYIKRCLESILNQTLKDYEIILVNDGSIDRSDEIIESFSAKYNFIRYTKIKNSGPGIARNRGIEIAEGKYICFADIDDYFSKNMLDTLYSVSEYEEADLSIGKIKVLNSFNEEFRSGISKKNYSGIDNIKNILGKESRAGYGFNHGKFYKNNILKKYDIKFKNTSFAEDILFNLEYSLKCNKIVEIDEEVYCYYQNQNSITHKHDEFRCEKVIYVANKINNFIKENKLEKEVEEEKNIYFEGLLLNYIADEIRGRKNYKKSKEHIIESNIITFFKPFIVCSKFRGNKRRLLRCLIFLNLNKIYIKIISLYIK